MKLILADDHTLFRNGLALLLKEHCPKCDIWEGDSLDAALTQAEAHPEAEAALLDLHMPGMNGTQGIRRFLESKPTLPLIMLTGVDEPKVINEALSAGASGYIPKSSQPAVMLSAIQLVLSGGTYIPPQVLVRGPAPMPISSQFCFRERTQTTLTDRQLQVLHLLAAGKPNKTICRELGIETGTVKAHIASIFRALDAVNRTEAVSHAKQLGLI